MKLLRITPIMMIALALATSTFAQPSQHGGAHLRKFEKKEKTIKAEDMPAMCKAMMGNHSAMAKEMKTMDARLDKKIAAMEKAKGDKRTTEMASVIRELVVQRKEMHAQMTVGMHNMMGHMMTHMQAGMMAQCPMMKDMMGGSDAATSMDGDHSKHMMKDMMGGSDTATSKEDEHSKHGH